MTDQATQITEVVVEKEPSKPAVLIDNWKQWHRLWSIRFALLGVFAGLVEALQPLLPLFVTVWPPATFAYVSVAFGVLSVVARVVKQNKLVKEATDGGADS